MAVIGTGPWSACGDGSANGGGGAGGVVDTAHQNALFDTETALSEATAAIIVAVSFNTNGFELDLTRESPPVGLEAEYDALVVSAELHAREALARAYELWRASSTVTFGTATAALTTSPDGHYRRAESRLALLTALGLGAGLAVLAYSFFSGTNDGVEASANHIVARIGSANEPELALMNRELGLADTASSEQTRAAVDQLSLVELLRAKRNLEIAFQDPDDDRVRPFTLEEVNRSRIDSTVKLGTTALETTVGAAQTATGGAGVAEIAGAVGATATQSTVLDIVYTLSGIPTAPEDEANVTIVSTEAAAVVVPRPATDMSSAEALRTLRDPSAGNDEVEDAAATLAREVATDPSLESAEDEDGALVVERPERVHSVRLPARASQELEVPALDAGVVAITPRGSPTQVTAIDASTTTVTYELSGPDGPAGPDAGTPDTGDGGMPQVCTDAFACARIADPEQAASYEDAIRQCFTAVGLDHSVCSQNCAEALASWRADGECP